MSTKAVLIWLALAVLLGLAALLLLRSPSGTSETPLDRIAVGQPLIAFSPADVTRLSVIPGRPEQPKQIIEKAPGGKGPLGADAEWQLRLEPAAGAGGPPQTTISEPWPISSAQMQALLRVMSQSTGVAVAPENVQIGEFPTTVEVQTRTGTMIWRLASRTLAGTGAVEITDLDAKKRVGIASDELHAVFTNPGPRGWRETALFAGIAPDVSRIKLSSKQQKLSLARVDGRWSMLEPVNAPADPGAVQRAIADLARIQVVDFLDSGVGMSSTGLEQPVASITVEADRRVIEPGSTDPKVQTDTLHAEIGGSADVLNTKLFASVNEKRTVVLSARTLQAISTDPATYIWPHPTRLVAADVAAISLDAPLPLPTLPKTRTFKRELQRWTESRTDTTDVPVSDQTRRDCESALIFLTGGERSAFSGGSAPVSSDERPLIHFALPQGARRVLTIDMRSATGTPLESLTVYMLTRDRTIFRTGNAFREFATAQVPAVIRDPALAAAAELKIPDLAAP